YPLLVPAALPEGDPAPRDGSLPGAATQQLGEQPLGVYVHIPFCRTRCGYCDFNTYTRSELGGGASQQAYPGTLRREIALARRVLAGDPPDNSKRRPEGAGGHGPEGAGGHGHHEKMAPPVSTVFFGGGTPTLLPPAEIGAI